MDVHSDRGAWVQFDFQEVGDGHSGNIIGFIGKVTWDSCGSDQAKKEYCEVHKTMKYKLFRGEDPHKVFSQTINFWIKKGGRIV